MILFRPVGLKEYLLIKESGFRIFPPRLPDQPYFYPVTNQRYVEEIASGWNTKDEFSGYVGIVLKFEVDSEYMKRFEKKIVGNTHHEEYWVPAVELDAFNAHITNTIEVVSVYVGDNFNPENFNEAVELKALLSKRGT